MESVCSCASLYVHITTGVLFSQSQLSGVYSILIALGSIITKSPKTLEFSDLLTGAVDGT